VIGTYIDNSILLPSGVKFLIRDGETEQDFIDRVKATVEDDYCVELEIEYVPNPSHQAAIDIFNGPKSPVQEADETLAETSNPQAYYRDNLHKFCRFTKRESRDTVEGMIIWVYLDRRKDLLYYRVKDGNGKIHIVRVNNPTLEIL